MCFCPIERLALKSSGYDRNRILWTGPKGLGRKTFVACERLLLFWDLYEFLWPNSEGSVFLMSVPPLFGFEKILFYQHEGVFSPADNADPQFARSPFVNVRVSGLMVV